MFSYGCQHLLREMCFLRDADDAGWELLNLGADLGKCENGKEGDRDNPMHDDRWH